MTDTKDHVTTSAQPLPTASPASKSAGPVSGRKLGWTAVAPGVLSLLLGIYQVGKPELWRDEIASVSASSRSLGDLFELLGHVDASTGFYYVLLHFWTGLFGDSLMALRLPSVIAMAAAAVLTAQIGARLYGNASGLAAGLVFALTPGISRYGQEIRAYALAVFAVALATFLLLRALERTGSRVRWLAYAAALVLVALAHVVALSCLIGHLVAVLLRVRRDGRRGPLLRFGGAVLLGVVCASPLMLIGHSQVKQQLSWLKAPDLSDPLHVGYQLWLTLYASRSAASIAAVLVVLGVLAPLLRERKREATVFVVSSAVLPIVAVALISQLGTSYFIARYLLFTLIAWSVLAGAGLVGAAALLTERVRLPLVRRPGARPVAAVLLSALALAAIWPSQTAVRSYAAHEWTNIPIGKSPGYLSYEGTADLLAAHALPGDGLVFMTHSAMMVDLGVDYYLHDRVRLDQVLVTRTPQQNGSYYSSLCPAPAACLATAPGRIWLVTETPVSYLTPVQTIERAALLSHYRIAKTYYRSDIHVSLLERTS